MVVTALHFSIGIHRQIVGFYGSSGHSFLLSGGSLTTIDVPGAMGTAALGINNAGQIVGSYSVGALEQGFLYHNGTYTTFDVARSPNVQLTGINDHGDIVGYYYDSQGIAHGFLATPIPEPATLLLAGIGTLGLIGWAGWRRLAAV